MHSFTIDSFIHLLPINAIVEGEVIFKGKDLLSLDNEEMRKIRRHDISMVFEPNLPKCSGAQF